MLTLRDSAMLLRSATSTDGLIRLARAVGFNGPATPLENEIRGALGIPGDVLEACIIAGPGSLRAMVFTTVKATALRETMTRAASRLVSRAPHVLWVLAGTESEGETVAIGAPNGIRTSPRLAALVLSRSRIMDSDAETLRLLAAANSPDALVTHARFVEILGRDAISRRFFLTLERCVRQIAASASEGSSAMRVEIALLYTSRLLFLGFLEAKGWLDGDPGFLSRVFDDCMASGGQFHARVMLPLFFGTLNTPNTRRARRARAFGRIPFLNGGLFTPTISERRSKSLRFGDESIGSFLGELLSRYRFTAREETASFEEAAIDPEMLGRAFECLMAAQVRRDSGVFYTPHDLVERVTSCGLEEVLAHRLGHDTTERLLHGETAPAAVSEEARRLLRTVRVLDPACGSGAFLVHALDRIAGLLIQCGEALPPEMIRRQVLATAIFGVDVNATAVWLCQLRLWLSIVIDTHQSVGSIPPLPNLDRAVRVGDSLAGEAFGEVSPVGGEPLRQLRLRYTRASGRRKTSLARLLDREERRLLIETTTDELARVSAARRDLVSARRSRDLFGERSVADGESLKQASVLRAKSAELRSRLRAIRRGDALPFSFPAHFADVAADKGFTLIVGNPPWVRPHRLDTRTREALRRRFVVAQSAAWAAGAEAAGAGRGFGSQVDLAALFVERSLRLLAPGGVLSLLLPAKLWRSLAGGGLRRFVTQRSLLARIEDYSDIPATFDAAVYPGLLVAARPEHSGVHDDADGARQTRVLVMHRDRAPTTWTVHPDRLAWDASTGAPWILLPTEVRRAFDSLRAAGVPFTESRFGRPLLGVKCGLNDAFLVTVGDATDELTGVMSTNGRKGQVETAFLRPVVRGEAVAPWAVPDKDQWLVWPHDRSGNVVRVLPPGLARWLAPHRRALLARSDAHSAQRWWSLFRTDGARMDVPRVIWADIGRTPRATMLPAGDSTVPLNSCYVVRCPNATDAMALIAVLNSPLIAAWLSIVAEPARGGYRRYLGWTMSLLPLPANWEAHRETLADLAHRARAYPGSVPTAELLDATIASFSLTSREVTPLLAWAAP